MADVLTRETIARMAGDPWGSYALRDGELGMLCRSHEELRARLERAETERDEARAELCREIDRGDGLFHEAAVYKAEREEARRAIEDALFLFGARSRNENQPEVTLDGWTKSARAALGAAGERGEDTSDG